MHPRFSTFKPTLDFCDDGDYMLFERSEKDQVFRISRVVNLKTTNGVSVITSRDHPLVESNKLDYVELHSGYGTKYLLTEVHVVKSATIPPQHSKHHPIYSILNSWPLRPDFTDNLTLVSETISGSTYVYKKYSVMIEDVLWDIICPPDHSFYLAIAEGRHRPPLHRADFVHPQIVTRQWEWADFGTRIPANQAHESWTIYGLLALDLETMTTPTSLSAQMLDMVYDLLFLHTHDPVATSDPDMTRVTITRERSKGLKSFGNIYNQKDNSFRLMVPERFKQIEPMKIRPFQDMMSGYYWLSVPGKMKAVVWVVSDIKAFYYSANVSTEQHLLSSLPDSAVFEMIAK